MRVVPGSALEAGGEVAAERTSARLPILYVDDEPENLDLFRLVFGDDLDIHTASSGEDALARLEALDAAVLVTDERMPGMTGIELLAKSGERWPDLVRVIVSAYGDGARLLAAINRGHAHEYVLKPWDNAELRDCLTRALVMARRRRELAARAELAETLWQAPGPADGADPLVGWRHGLSRLAEVVRRAATCQATVLVTGETGTGKELVARAIHDISPRQRGPFVAVNCGALTDGLLESELFGHEQGAFTGAARARKGRFELADGGTLFLDEIGDVSPHVQLALLRALQERTIERVGGCRSVGIDVRIIAATHRDLPALVRAGQFRQDLHYRLDVLPVHVPPLRERQQDLPLLVAHFLRKHRQSSPSGRLPRLGHEALQLLRRYSWPGNVRELENMVQRALVMCDGDELLPDDFTFFLPPAPAAAETVREEAVRLEAARLRECLLAHGGNFSRAARAAGMPRTTLVSRAKKLGLL